LRPFLLCSNRWCAKNELDCMKNTAKADKTPSATMYCVLLFGLRVSGKVNQRSRKCCIWLWSVSFSSMRVGHDCTPCSDFWNLTGTRAEHDGVKRNTSNPGFRKIGTRAEHDWNMTIEFRNTMLIAFYPCSDFFSYFFRQTIQMRNAMDTVFRIFGTCLEH
jgi:hypothetical protein